MTVFNLANISDLNLQAAIKCPRCLKTFYELNVPAVDNPIIRCPVCMEWILLPVRVTKDRPPMADNGSNREGDPP